MRKITLGLIIGIILILILIVIIFIYYATASTNKENPNNQQGAQNPFAGNTSQIVIEEVHIKYLINDIGGYNLHNPPLSSDRPKIDVVVDESNFKAEVDNGNINVEKGSWESPDIKIRTTRSEVISAVESGSIKDYMKNSIASGKTGIDMIAGYTKLFSKGYLSLYQDLTGKSLTGSVIKIFSSG